MEILSGVFEGRTTGTPIGISEKNASVSMSPAKMLANRRTVSDITRAWQRNDRTLPLLLNYLNRAGIPDENIRVVIAVGGHRHRGG